MCKGGSKKVETNQEQFQETAQENYGKNTYRADPLAYDAASYALQRARHLAGLNEEAPLRGIAGFNVDQDRALTNIRQLEGYANPYIQRGANLTNQGANMLTNEAHGLTQQGAHEIANSANFRNVGAGYSHMGADYTGRGAHEIANSANFRNTGADYSREAADYARGAAGPVGLQELDVNKYLNPYANYMLSGLNEKLGAQNKMKSGSMASAMGGVGGDRAGVADAVSFGQDQLARGQLMADVYGRAVPIAQQQQGAQYAADSGNRSALGSVASQIAGIGSQFEERARGQQALGQGLLGAGSQYGAIGSQFEDKARGQQNLGQGLLGAGSQYANIGNSLSAMGGQYANLGLQGQRAGMEHAGALNTLGTQRQSGRQEELDAYYKYALAQQQMPWQQVQMLSQVAAGLAPVVGGSAESYNAGWGTQKSSGSGTQTTTTEQSPWSMLGGLASMGLGLASGNPFAAMGGLSQMFGGGGSFGNPNVAGGGFDSGGNAFGSVNGQPANEPMSAGHGSRSNEQFSRPYKHGGSVLRKSEGGEVNDLLFNPELSDELRPVDRNSKEFSDMVFNKDRDVYEPAEPDNDYFNRMDRGEAPDYREALLRHGKEILSAPGNENYLNRNIPPDRPSNPYAGIGAINEAAPLAAGPEMPGGASSFDEMPRRTPLQPPKRRSIEELEEDVIREQLERRREPSERPPDMPYIPRRQVGPRSMWGPDGRLMEFGLRLLASTGDRDSNGVPTGFGAGIGKAGVGVLDSERKHRDEQRKDSDNVLEDIKAGDAMKRWRHQTGETARGHDLTDDQRRLQAILRSQTAREARETRERWHETRKSQIDEKQESDKFYRSERLRQHDERTRLAREQAEERNRVANERLIIAKERLNRGELIWMGQDKDGNALLYDKRRTGEDGQPLIIRAPVGEILPKPRAKPQGASMAEVQQEARRMAEIDARYRDIKPTDMTKHLQETMPKYIDMVKTMWGLQGGPAPREDTRPSATPERRPGQDAALATEVARLKNIGKTWPQIRDFLKSQGVPDPELYQ